MLPNSTFRLSPLILRGMNRPLIARRFARRKTAVQEKSGRAPRSTSPPRSTAPQYIKFTDMTFLHDDVQKAVKSLGLTRPTAIQSLALPKLCRGDTALCAAETGSGKTLAYLLPLVSHLRKQETEEGLVTRMRRPRAIVLVPSTELARQVLKCAKGLAHAAPFRAAGIFGGLKTKRVDNQLDNAVDVVVATPGLLVKHMAKGEIFLSDVCYAVVDEADTMFREDFAEEVLKILKPLTERKIPREGTRAIDDGQRPSASMANAITTRPVQVVVATATVTRPFLRTLEETFSKMKRITTPRIHQCFDKVKHVFLRVKGHDDTKQEMIMDILNKDMRRQDKDWKTIVFCNTHRSVEWLSSVLQDKKITHAKVHKAMNVAIRQKEYEKFVNGPERFLLSTDIASRGLDTMGVKHVVMVDFPKTVTDYLHRAGRTGRLNAAGLVTSLYSTKDVELAQKIELAVNKDRTLGKLFKDLALPEEYGNQSKPVAVAYGLTSSSTSTANNKSGFDSERRKDATTQSA